jgi:hypothetical protein
MVTGTGVGGEADAEGTEPIVKKAIKHSAMAAEILLCRIISIFFFSGELMTAFPLQRNCRAVAAGNCGLVLACSLGPNLLQAAR